MPLFFVFIVIPLVELMLLLEVGSMIGSGWTFLIIIATAILGTRLVKQQGTQTWSKIQTELNQGALPAQAMFDGVCILVSGVLLITPGFMTDIFGLLLLTPPFRKAVYSSLGQRVQVKSSNLGGGQFGGGFGAGFGSGSDQQGPFSQGNTYEHDSQANQPSGTHPKEDAPSKPKVLEGEFIRKD